MKLDGFSKQMEFEEFYFLLKLGGGSKHIDWKTVPKLRDIDVEVAKS